MEKKTSNRNIRCLPSEIISESYQEKLAIPYVTKLDHSGFVNWSYYILNQPTNKNIPEHRLEKQRTDVEKR